MPRYEFQCDTCSDVEEVIESIADHDSSPYPCTVRECSGTMRRVFGVPAIGRGSSGGTPARGHQRFVKGDAGWTNG
ncbi:MAG TPA: FmdB family zinc ribbon protein [Agromyces sp.]